MYFLLPSSFHYFIYDHFYYLSLFCNVWASVCSFKTIEDRSSRPELFCKKGILRNSEKFTGNHLCQRHFFNKVAALRRFPVSFVKFLRTTFFTEHLRWLLLRRVISHHFSSKDRDSVFIIFFIIQVKTKRFVIHSNFSSDIASTSVQHRQSISLTSFLQHPHLHQSTFPFLISDKSAAEALEAWLCFVSFSWFSLLFFFSGSNWNGWR